MIKFTSLTLLLFFSSLKISAQATKDSQIQNDYLSYFSENRSVHLHLNKTTFLPKESLWFSAYVYQAFKNLPDLETTNLQVALFGKNNEKISSKTILINGSKDNGFFKLQDLEPGVYNVVASQDKHEIFQQQIRIIPEKLKKISPQPYDLQVLPEGGRLLADTENSVGFKFLDSRGRGRELKVYLLNNTGDTLKDIKSNQFGMGKFYITPNSGEQYEITAMIDSSRISKKLPDAVTSGINLTIERLENKFIVSIRTNKQTLENIKDQNFKILIHNGMELQQLEFSFAKNELEKVIPLESNLLQNGVNIITVFDSNFNPLVERMIFKGLKNQRVPVSAKFMKKENDSLLLNVSSNMDSLAANSLSISILPSGSKSYHPRHNIISSFKLKPYINGNIEQPAYYFTSSIDLRRRLYDLDLLLLNQGWSKYEWDDIFKGGSQKRKPIKRGFTIQGTVNNENTESGDKVFLKSEEIGLFEIVTLDKNKSFQISDLFVLDSTQVNIGLTKGKRQKIIKPDLYVRILPKEDLFKNLQFSEKQFPEIYENNPAPDNPGMYNRFIRSAESLDTIEITASKEKKELRSDNFGNTKQMDEELRNRFLYVTSYIAVNGFKVRRELASGQVYIFNNRFGRRFSPTIQLDGINLTDHSILYGLRTSDVESIYINKSGGGVMGKTSIGGLIRIKTLSGEKRKNLDENYSPNTYRFVTKTGFARNKEFYAPQYRSYTDDRFREYGVIDWKNNISLDEKGNASFKILNTLQNEVDLFIEGMTIDGKLISEKISIETR